MLHHVVALPLLPLLLAQAVWVKKNTLRLPEPDGAREGCVGDGNPLSLLILGDSAGAGVGVKHQSEALSGQLIETLAERFSVKWRLVAWSGATTLDMLTHLKSAPINDTFDVVVYSLGVNDVTSKMSVKNWLNLQKSLSVTVRQQTGCQLEIKTGIPPMAKFPALPQPLRYFLGRRAENFDHALKNLIDTQRDTRYLHLPAEQLVGGMAEDGFHPGAAIYRMWAKAVAKIIFDHFSVSE